MRPVERRCVRAAREPELERVDGERQAGNAGERASGQVGLEGKPRAVVGRSRRREIRKRKPATRDLEADATGADEEVRDGERQ